MEGNIALTAKRLDINIADAQLKSSKVYSDPTLAVTYSNNEDWSKKLGQGIEVPADTPSGISKIFFKH